MSKVGIPSLLVLSMLTFLGGCGGREPLVPPKRGFTQAPPPNPMPAPGERVRLDAGTLLLNASGSPDDYVFQWFKDGMAIPGATLPALDLGQVSIGDAGLYQARLTPKAMSAEGSNVTLGGATTLAQDGGPGVVWTEDFVLEPADHLLVVQSEADAGPGTLREALEVASGLSGVTGILLALPPDRPQVIRLDSSLPPLRGDLRILGPQARWVSLDGNHAHRPFFVADGRIALSRFRIAHGLGKGGDALGGGGGAAGMGGGLFINGGDVVLRKMVFEGNVAQGGTSFPGTDGENGGGAGFGGDSPARGGSGASGGLLGGVGGVGHLDGAATTDTGGGPAVDGDGAGGGASRGGTLDQPLASWADNLPGGDATFGGGGGFSVGPMGGGGNGASVGGGGGGSGGSVFGSCLGGSYGGAGGWFGGDGQVGDGLSGARGGGGGGLGGAVFFKEGRLNMVHCSFKDNAALAGDGWEPGFSKGGAIFIYPYHRHDPLPSYPLEILQAQSYENNHAKDLVEDPPYDNDDFFVAQTQLLVKPGTALDLLYRLYRLERRLGLPWRRFGSAP